MSSVKFETATETSVEQRRPLTRQRVLEAAVDLADRDGIESVSMRRLGQELGIEAMSLYTHVRNKEDLLDGMVDVVIGQVSTPRAGIDWKASLRRTILAARLVLLRHPWAPGIIETREAPGPAILRHYDTVMGILRGGGFSLELTHHALHMLGSRMLGFARDLFDDSSEIDPLAAAAFAEQIGGAHPHVAEMATATTHEGGLGGCDTNVEFAFALDAMLDSLDRLRDAG
jgi:AcrR family transcriptional regulator